MLMKLYEECNNPTIKGKWSNEFPQEQGFWWFYGIRFGRNDSPELMMVEVYKSGGKDNTYWTYIASGTFLYDSEVKGKWCKASVPKID